MFWCDGFFPLGKDFLRTLPGVGPILHEDSESKIAFFDFFNIGSTPYCLVFHVNGSIHAVNTLTRVSIDIAPGGTIVNPSVGGIGITQWGSTFVLIVVNQTNGYFAWDGTTFYSAGQVIPGHGTMPTGIQGTTIEVYTSRVWVGKGATITFSAPGDFIDFSTSNGGGSFTSNDSFLRVGFSSLKSTNGFLYMIADSSINYISGVNTTGSGPAVTTFTNQNADPEIGTPYANTVDVFSRNILLANAFGAHVSYGGAVTKISDNLDGIYATVPNFGGLALSAAKAIIFGKKVWMVLIPVIDLITGQQVNKLFMWDNKKWFSSSQDVNLIYVQHQEINSVLTAYGTDGKAIYPLFQQPSTAFTKTVQSKLWERPSYVFERTASRLFGLAIYYSNLAPDIVISVDSEFGSSPQTYPVGPILASIVNASGQPVSVVNALGQPVTVFAGSNQRIVVFPPAAVAQHGALLGLTLTTQAADMALVSLTLVDEIFGYRG